MMGSQAKSVFAGLIMLAMAIGGVFLVAGQTSDPIPPGDGQAWTPATPEATASSRLPGDVMRLRQARIMDPGYFNREMLALTLMIPADWQDQGAVQWANTNCQQRMQQINWEARSPDGRERMQILPAEGWKHTRSNMGGVSADPYGCPDWTFGSLREYLEAWIAHNRPGARVLDFEVSPEISQMMSATVPPVPAMEGITQSHRAEAGRALLAYQESGVEVRELLSTGLIVHFTQMWTPDYGTGFSYQSESIVGATLPMFTARAPAGQLDFDRIDMLTGTLRQNPEYAAEVSRHFAILNNIAIEGEKDRHEIQMNTINYLGQLSRENYANRMSSMDRASHQSSQATREVQTWVDPVSNQPVELPMHYRNAWRMNDGTYLMTDNDGFEPWRDLQLSGERMQMGRQ